MTTTVSIEVESASRGVRLHISVDGVPAQLENDETFVLPFATINLNVEMGSDAAFPRMRGKTKESRRTPQTETADPCRGCISHLKFSLWFTMKVQHCKSRGIQCKCRPRLQWLHHCEVVTPQLSPNAFRVRGQDLWTMSNKKSPGLDGPSAVCGTFRLPGGLPRGVAVLGNRRLGLSGIGIPHRCPFR